MLVKVPKDFNGKDIYYVDLIRHNHGKKKLYEALCLKFYRLAVHNQESSLSPPSLFVNTGVGNSFLGTLNIVHP